MPITVMLPHAISSDDGGGRGPEHLPDGLQVVRQYQANTGTTYRGEFYDVKT